jgi:hypothetical protein
MDDDALTSSARTSSAARRHTVRLPRRRLALQSSLPAAASSAAEGNERLTAMIGSVLLVLLLVECYTILRLGRLPTLVTTATACS